MISTAIWRIAGPRRARGVWRKGFCLFFRHNSGARENPSVRVLIIFSFVGVALHVAFSSATEPPDLRHFLR
jgi:hypothetical protein